MSDRVVSVIRLPAAATHGTIEVEIAEPTKPPRWQGVVAVWLIRCAGRLARMRVRIT